ncbi:hypothetical protein PENTCL1PPCAC_8143, partial [Pristionchus entomophagus]
MTRVSREGDLHPPRTSLAVVDLVDPIFRSQSFIECESEIELPELIRLNKLPHPIAATDLLIGAPHYVHCATELTLAAAKVTTNGFEVLRTDTLHVLRASRVDATLLILVRRVGV